jgi:hypothetical protein
MIHSFAKLISEMLALRLAPRMDEIMDKNQNAFIRTRSIHDNYKYVQRAAVLIYVTWIRQGGAVSRIGYASDTDTRPIRDGYVSEEYPIFY